MIATRFAFRSLAQGRPLNLPQFRRHTTKSPFHRRDHTASAPAASSNVTTLSSANAAPKVVEVDGMPRWPSLTSAPGLLRTLDWVGTVSFAHSGALLAASLGMDLLGTAAVGTVTAVGGGTIRDAMFLSRSPFWTSETEYLLLCAATAIATFALWPVVSDIVPEDHPALFAGDTLGIAAFCVIGAQNGIRAGMPPAVSMLCGMATATFGGAVRDVLCKRDVRIFHSHAEIYATTAAGGATAYLVARAARVPVRFRIAAGLGTAGMLRYFAWMEGIRLPTWHERVGENVCYAEKELCDMNKSNSIASEVRMK